MCERWILKNNAKSLLRNYYWNAFLACLVLNLISGVAAGFQGTFSLLSNVAYGFATEGAFEAAGVQTLPSGGLLNMAISIFLINVLTVGLMKFFIKSRTGVTSVGEVFSAFSGNGYLNTVLVMFLKQLFVFLWALLFVIPGIVKSYEYFYVEYILAENPEMTYHDALALSRRMTQGEKWNIFKLQFSFIPWYLLCILTFGIGFFFLEPYVRATYVESYECLKERLTSEDL